MVSALHRDVIARKPRYDRRSVTERHEPSSNGNRQWFGRVFVALVLFAGCSTPDGSQGGRCKQGCNNNYCDSGLECDNTTNTCVSSIGPQTPPTGCNFNGADSRCGTSQIGYDCENGSTPSLSGYDVPGCTKGSADTDETTLYCCTPSCEERLPPRCGAPSATSICSGTATPDDGDASTSCVALLGYWGFTEYCCAPADTCFTGPSDVSLESECSPDELTLCTGSAAPSQPGGTCSAIALDAGTGVTGYCCTPSIDDAGSSD